METKPIQINRRAAHPTTASAALRTRTMNSPPTTSTKPTNAAKRLAPRARPTAGSARAPLSTVSSSCPASDAFAVPTWNVNAPVTTWPSAEVTRHTTA